jgi:hypothetical protein
MLLAASCGGGSGTLNNTAGTNSATLSLNTSSVDFGNVALGSNKVNSIMLQNTAGSKGLNIVVSQITISGAAYSVNLPGLPLTLPPGQSSNVAVIFAPTTAGLQTGSLTITVSGASTSILVSLTGTGLAAGQLGVSPSSMDFGNVAVGSSQDQNGTLTAGSSDITVSSANWSGSGFSLAGISFPVTLSAGSSASFTVSFAPQTAGTSSGQVSFLSDANNSPTILTLSGTGTQNVSHSVDLSWGASTSQVVGYNIYRSVAAGGPFTRVNNTVVTGVTFTDSSVQSGATYYYAATAVDSGNSESAYSNIAIALVP